MGIIHIIDRPQRVSFHFQSCVFGQWIGRPPWLYLHSILLAIPLLLLNYGVLQAQGFFEQDSLVMMEGAVFSSVKMPYQRGADMEERRLLRASSQLRPVSDREKITVEISEQDSLALVAFYHATGGPNWRRNDNWLQTRVYRWYGVGGGRSGRVTSLRLSDNQLRGSIPPELGNLTALRWLWLQGNELTGGIPAQLGELINLEDLFLSGNQLSGPIPSSLGQLKKLELLVLAGNQFNGSIPPELGNLTQLTHLALSNTQLSGSIPSSLGRLSSLRVMTLMFNRLTGPIPPELGDLTNLESLGLADNQLEGSIPSQLSRLTNLKELVLGENQLSGSIPPELGRLSALEDLYLDRNLLTGEIPQQLAGLTKLRDLVLYENQLSGSIPPELGNLANLRILSLRENRFSGPIPPELSQLPNVTTIDLSDNKLSGPIPPELSELTTLKLFFLDNNQLSGVVPLSVAQLGTDLQRRGHPHECRFSGNDGLCIPDTQPYRELSIGALCGLWVSSTCGRAVSFYNQNRYSFGSTLIGGSHKSNTPVKICADGSTDATLVTIAGSESEEKHIVLRIKEDPAEENPGLFGVFTRDEGVADSTVFRYQHPDRTDTPSQFRDVHLEVVDTSDEERIIYEHPLRIYRAPVVMIHGLWSDSDAFAPMDASLQQVQWPDELTYRADYWYSNDQAFKENVDEVDRALRTVIMQAVADGYSLNRVNVVGHSMGGILARLYLQSDVYDYDNHFARLITINTPHSGSQMANFLLNFPNLKKLFRAAGHNPDGGAVEDLRVNSSAILFDLNDPTNANNNTTSSHAVVSTALVGEVPLAGWPKLIANFIESNWGEPLQQTVDKVFNQRLNDLVVADLSQAGGLDLFLETSHVSDQWHVGSPANEKLILEVMTLLNTPPEDNAFAHDRFRPPILTYDDPWPAAQGKRSSVTGRQKGTVSITGPSQDAHVKSGEQLPVSIASSETVSAILFAAGNASLGIDSEVFAAPTTTFVYDIPQEAVGSLSLVVAGFSEEGFVGMDSLQLNVATPAPPDSIQLTEDSMYLLRGQSASIPVVGYYENGINRDLSRHPEIVFATDNERIASFRSPGVLVGNTAGTTMMTLQYGEDILRRPVTVMPDETPVANAFPPVSDNDRRVDVHHVRNYPNPFNSSTTIQYHLPRADFIRLSIYDVLGRQVRLLVREYQNGGEHQAVFDAEGLASGLYIYRLEAGSHINHGMMLLKK